MLLTLLFILVVLCAGVTAQHCLSGGKGRVELGAAPAAGIALLAVLGSWSTGLGLHALLGQALIASTVLAAPAIVWRRRAELFGVPAHRPRPDLSHVLVGLASLYVLMMLSATLGQLPVPVSSHDGAYHVELIQSLRDGVRQTTWYPQGLHVTIALVLRFFPFVDTAAGTALLSLGLSVLAPLAVFDFGRGVWGDPRIAAAGAIAMALTYLYPYGAQLWGGWPMLAGLILVLGLWRAALDYLRRPSVRTALFCGFLAGAMLLIHGIELYSAALGLAVLALALRHHLFRRRLILDVASALLVAAAVAGPYVPQLLGWAGAGGAQEAAVQAAVEGATPAREMVSWVPVLGGGMVELPVRILLLTFGVAFALRRRRGRVLVPLGLAFFGAALLMSFPDSAAAQRIFALTFPWGMPDRLAHVQAVSSALLQGAGICAVIQWVLSLRDRLPGWFGTGHPVAWRRLKVGLGIVALVGVQASTLSIYRSLILESAAFVAYSPADAAAMEWLGGNASPRAVVANDLAADAGVWVPYKAGLPILVPRSGTHAGTKAALVLAHVSRLEASEAARAAACALRVGYVFRGEKSTAWEPRHFPDLDELGQSTVLEMAFRSGGAAVFRTKLDCPS